MKTKIEFNMPESCADCPQADCVMGYKYLCRIGVGHLGDIDINEKYKKERHPSCPLMPIADYEKNCVRKRIYIISHRDHEDNYDEFATMDLNILEMKIDQYKRDKKENCISIKVFEEGKNLLYAKHYNYSETTANIFDDCTNMEDEYWDC